MQQTKAGDSVPVCVQEQAEGNSHTKKEWIRGENKKRIKKNEKSFWICWRLKQNKYLHAVSLLLAYYASRYFSNDEGE